MYSSWSVALAANTLPTPTGSSATSRTALTSLTSLATIPSRLRSPLFPLVTRYQIQTIWWSYLWSNKFTTLKVPYNCDDSTKIPGDNQPPYLVECLSTGVMNYSLSFPQCRDATSFCSDEGHLCQDLLASLEIPGYIAWSTNPGSVPSGWLLGVQNMQIV